MNLNNLFFSLNQGFHTSLVWFKDGQVPYNDDSEFIMDILKHGALVEVIEPQELRDKLYDEINQMQSVYQQHKPT